MNEKIIRKENGDAGDFEDFLRLLTDCVPQKSVDGARYLIDYWNEWAQSNEFRNGALPKWKEMDDALRLAFGQGLLEGKDVNRCICQAVPEVFRNFPIWRRKSIRVAGRDISPSELFEDPFTRLLAWSGVVGIMKEHIVPGYLLNPLGEYVYGGLSGAMANFGHLFSNPAWREAVVFEIANQYDLAANAGKGLFSEFGASQDEIYMLVFLLKKVIAWGERIFAEEYNCMAGADSFYTQCSYAYNPGIRSMQVRSTTSGAVIPIEKSGGKIQAKHSARRDYFEKGLLGPGTEGITIFYQWDRDKTAKTLADEQKKAEAQGRGVEHRQEAVSTLTEYLKRPNIELSEGRFSGIWEWKKFFTLVSENRVAFSGRDNELKKNNHGLWVNHSHKPFLMNCIKELVNSDELSAEEKNVLMQGLPNAKHVKDLTMLLYKAEKKNVLKYAASTMANPVAYATEIVDELLSRGRKLNET